jgi:hypothetical protein
MSDLFSIFTNLSVPTPHDAIESFSAASLPGAAHRIAKDIHGWPALLLSSSTAVDESPRIRLEHLDIQHSVPCRITNSSGVTEDGAFTVVRCTESDDELTRYFLRAFDPILRSLGPDPTAPAISRAVNSLVELFRALTQPASKSVSGLWAELLVIRQASDPVALLQVWHISPEDKFDFNAGAQRVEVKSTSQRIRVHNFSLEQLLPPTGCRLIIASLFVERAGGGTSVESLLDEIRELVEARPDLQERLDRVVASTLGSALRQSLTERFDRELACDSMHWFDGGAVPVIPTPLPWGISDVHFRADLSQCPPVSRQTLGAEGGVFAALVGNVPVS